MDIIDDAARTETQFQKMALKRQLSGQKPRPVQSALCCLECNAEIPQARREAVPGCQYCVQCQSKRE